jgi:hypothetical protein
MEASQARGVEEPALARATDGNSIVVGVAQGYRFGPSSWDGAHVCFSLGGSAGVAHRGHAEFNETRALPIRSASGKTVPQVGQPATTSTGGGASMVDIGAEHTAGSAVRIAPPAPPP